MNSGWLFLGLSILTYGTWGLLAKMAQQRGASAYLLTILTSIGTVIVAVAICLPAIAGTSWRPGRWAIGLGILGGVCVGLGNVFLYQSLRTVPASIAYSASSLYVPVTVLLAVVCLHERVDLLHAFGIVLAVASVFILSR